MHFIVTICRSQILSNTNIFISLLLITDIVWYQSLGLERADGSLKYGIKFGKLAVANLLSFLWDVTTLFCYVYLTNLNISMQQSWKIYTVTSILSWFFEGVSNFENICKDSCQFSAPTLWGGQVKVVHSLLSKHAYNSDMTWCTTVTCYL